MIRKPLIMCMTVLLCTCFSVTSCYDDSLLRTDIENLEDRVTALEDWQKSVNNEISTIKSLITALEQKNFITEVEEFDGGYKVHLQTGEVLTINHGTNGIDGEDGKDGIDGKDGHSPEIGVAKDGDVYYWTLDGKFILDADGKKLPVTGPKGDKGDDGEDGEDGADGEDAVAPQVRINKDTNYWEISIDGGKTWESTDVKATGPKGDKGDKGDKGETGEAGADGEDGKNGSSGDSFFSKVDYTTSPNYVIFYLKNGTEIVVPRASAGVQIKFNTNLTISGGNTSVKIEFANLEKDDFDAVVVEVLNSEGTTYKKFATKALSGITVSDVVFPTDGTPYVNVTINGVADNEKALLNVTLIYKDGSKLSHSRLVTVCANVISAINATSGESDKASPEEFVLSGTASVTDNNIHVDQNESLTIVMEAGSSITNTNNADGAIQVEGTMTITGNGVIESSGDEPAIVVESGGVLTIDENVTVGTDDEGKPAIVVNGTGKVIINNGTFVSNSAGTAPPSQTSTKAAADFDGCVIYAGTGTEIVINGGIFQGKEKTKLYEHLLVAEGGKITIYGGTFYGFQPSSNMLGSGLRANPNGNNCWVVGQPQAITTEALLRDAFEAGSSTITLAGNIKLTSPIIVKSTTTLDLKNYSITPAAATLTAATGTNAGSDDGLIYVTKGANLTIKGTGSLDVSGTSVAGAIMLTEKDIDDDNATEDHKNKTAQLTINGPTLRGNGFAISGNGTRHGTEVKITSGKLIADGLAIYHPQVGNLKISGANTELSGVDAAIEMRSGNLIIENGKFTSTANSSDYNSNGDGTTTEGAALAIVRHKTGNKINVTIKGGTFNGVYALYQKYDNLDSGVSAETAGKTTISLEGGTFNGKIYSELGNDCLSSSKFIFVETADNEYEMLPIANGVVTLTKSLTLYSPIFAKEGNLTLDLGAYNLTDGGIEYISGKQAALIEVQGGSLTIKGTGSVKSTVEEDNYAVYVRNGATVNIEGGVYEGSCTAVHVYEGIANIKGGTYSQVGQVDNRYVLNCYDTNYKNSTAKIIVTGGTFKGFNPQNNLAEGPDTNFCPSSGYHVISSDDVYTVESNDAITTLEILSEVINSATSDISVKLAADITGNLTIVQKEGVNLVIDGNQHNYVGTIIIDGAGRSNGAETLTIQNVAFTTSSAITTGFIRAENDENISNNYNYAHNVTVKNCTFAATGEGLDKVVGMYYRQCFNLKVENCTAVGLHSLIQDTNSSSIEVNGVTINGRGGVSFSGTETCSVSNSEITATKSDGYAIRVGIDPGTGSKNSLNVKDCKLTAYLPIVQRFAKGTHTIALEGTNTLTTTGTGEYQIVATNGNDGTFEEPTGTVTITGAGDMTVYNPSSSQ